MTPTTEELIQILEAVVAPEFESTYCDDVAGVNWFDARDKAVAELSRREDRFVFVADLPVEALQVAITDGDHAYSSLTAEQVQQLRDLLLAIRGEETK